MAFAVAGLRAHGRRRDRRPRLRRRVVPRLLRAARGARRARGGGLMRRIVVAIDGPAGAGKSTREPRARAAARLRATSTRARCIASSACSRAERGIALDDDAALAASGRRAVASSCATAARRSWSTGATCRRRSARADAGELASRVSTRPVVRERLVALQRALGDGGRRGDGGPRHRHGGVPGRAGEALPDRRAGRAGAAARGGAPRARRGGGRGGARPRHRGARPPRQRARRTPRCARRRTRVLSTPRISASTRWSSAWRRRAACLASADAKAASALKP